MGKGFFINNNFFLAPLIVFAIMICSSASSAQVDVTSPNSDLIATSLVHQIGELQKFYITANRMPQTPKHASSNLFHGSIMAISEIYLGVLDKSHCTIGNTHWQQYNTSQGVTYHAKGILESLLRTGSSDFSSTTRNALVELLDALEGTDPVVVFRSISNVLGKLTSSSELLNVDQVSDIFVVLRLLIGGISEKCVINKGIVDP